MIYEEKRDHNKVIVAMSLLLLAFLFAPVFLEIQELVSNEGFYLAAVREMDHYPPLMKVQGDVCYGGFPFYPMLVRALVNIGIPMIIALRLLPILCFFAIAGIVFLTAWKAKDLTAGIVGSSVVMLNFLSIEKFSGGNPVMLGTLGVFSAWMVWYALGFWRGKWKLAWITTFLIAGMTFYTLGFTGLIMIIFPMLFHRRPLMIWTKPRGQAFFIGLAILILFVLFWGFPRWTLLNEPVWERTMISFPSAREYFLHLLTFPFDAAISLMPWTLFAWAPFCPAIVPLDENPMLSRYLRTLFLGTFVLLWLSPLTQSRDVFFMIPPLAVLIALNYWIVVRRYGWRLLKLFNFTAVLILLFCAASFMYLIISRDSLPTLVTDMFRDMSDTPYWKLALAGTFLGGIAALTTIFMCLSGERVWLAILMLMSAMILPYRTMILPYQNLNRSKEQIGNTFREAIPEKETPDVVYRMHNIPPYYSEMHYFGITLKTIGAAEELPSEKTVVYVFSQVVPSAPERIWERVSFVSYKKQKIELWRGKLKMEEDYE